MTDDKIEIIVRMYKDERNYTAIAREAGLSVYQVKRWVRLNRDAYGLTRRRSLTDKSGALSLSTEIDSPWNIKASKRYLTMKWSKEA